MTLSINGSQQNLLKPRISVFGIGGAGGNALNNMIKSKPKNNLKLPLNELKAIQNLDVLNPSNLNQFILTVQ